VKGKGLPGGEARDSRVSNWERRSSNKERSRAAVEMEERIFAHQGDVEA
jgi:hypothetical protein